MELTEPLGPRLAEGRTAEVFAFGDGRVVKLYRPGWPDDEAMHEFHRARAAFGAGAPTPEPIRHGNRNGRPALVFVRADGLTLLERVRAGRETAPQTAATLAEVHARLHALRPSGLPTLHQRIVSRVGDEPRLAALPPGDSLCHGDFHPSNVVLPEGGAPIVLDWVDATLGPPEADVARTLLLIRGGGLEDENGPEAALRRAFADAYLARYRECGSLDPALVGVWLPVLARVRRTEGPLPAAEVRLLDQIEAGDAGALIPPTPFPQ